MQKDGVNERKKKPFEVKRENYRQTVNKKKKKKKKIKKKVSGVNGKGKLFKWKNKKLLKYRNK